MFDEFKYDREMIQWNVFATDFKRDRASCPHLDICARLNVLY